MADLPEEVIEEILSRLPVKSLLSFKSVSKNWYSLISQNHKFAKFHLKQSSSSSSKNPISYFYQLNSDEAPFHYSDADGFVSRRISFPIKIDIVYRILGSANGLICVYPYRIEPKCCFVWNPCTGEYKRIPVPVVPKPPGYNAVSVRVCRLFGFGYDSISDDYKILGNWDSHFQVFSLKTNSWKILECSMKLFMGDALYLNGALHFCVGPQITAFDLAKYQFFFLDLPVEINPSDNSTRVSLFEDHQGSLCATGGNCNSIWAMKEYRNSKSWFKLTMSTLPWKYAKPVGISKLGEVVLRTQVGLVKSDIQGTMSDEDAKKLLLSYQDAFVYKESLISPNCFDP